MRLHALPERAPLMMWTALATLALGSIGWLLRATVFAWCLLAALGGIAVLLFLIAYDWMVWAPTEPPPADLMPHQPVSGDPAHEAGWWALGWPLALVAVVIGAAVVAAIWPMGMPV